jgi:molecular chaperone GrpE (heat shock protein)
VTSIPLFRRHERKTPIDTVSDQEATASRNAARELELALGEANRRIRQLEADVTRLSAATATARDQAAQRVLDDLAEAVAAPLAHLVGQQAILTTGTSELTAQDVAVVAGQILRALERAGVQLHGRVGDTVPFDPDIHLVVGDRQAPAVGASVVIRSPGVSGPSGRLARKAAVEPA